MLVSALNRVLGFTLILIGALYCLFLNSKRGNLKTFSVLLSITLPVIGFSMLMI
ncbi:hypothetical protein [Clostridium hydrogeniformans]|uniref:hypothetical protein n=1 Tax=Clostridium hydrogeniformans TaxID=349933 RepID=UPI001363AEF2|nr:hypothetical protein [Clostridium hydrogeniformans]